MTPSEFKTVAAFEAGLTIGSPVAIRFTNCHRFYRGKGVVSKINKKSVRVKLTEPLPSQMGGAPYPVGHELVSPLLTNFDNWTANNRVEPVDGYTFNPEAERSAASPA